ncbi:MAG: L-lactate dehydrogenase [Candidatus Sumerlaeia bacterium]|nr:L-lactate dehydrogenase [Candidatus Sumerlaeia bacterium]
MRTALVGVGQVGAALAYGALTAGVSRELTLVDYNVERTRANLLDLRHCQPWGNPVALNQAETIEACEGHDLLVVSASMPAAPTEGRMELLKRNAELFSRIIPELARRNPGAVLLVITNPVDVMTRLALEFSGFPPERVFGTGTTLDSARFREVLSRRLGLSPSNIHAHVIGEHGDTEVLVWSRAHAGPFSVFEFAERVGRPLDAGDVAAISHEVRSIAYSIMASKGNTAFAIAETTLRLMRALRGRLPGLFTVTRALGAVEGKGDLCMSLPCMVSGEGAQGPFPLDLSAEERGAFAHSASVLEAAYDRLGL